MKKKIEVTQEDIKNGIRESANTCPIALAVTRAYGGRVLVNSGVIIWDNGTGRPQIFSFPENVRQFIINFDKGLQVKPFEFEIEFQQRK